MPVLLSNSLQERLRQATQTPQQKKLGHLRLVILLCLKWPKYLRDVNVLLEDMELPVVFDFNLPFKASAKHYMFEFQHSMIIQELAFQVYRYLKYGRELDRCSPSTEDMQACILELTLEEARKYYGT